MDQDLALAVEQEGLGVRRGGCFDRNWAKLDKVTATPTTPPPPISRREAVMPGLRKAKKTKGSLK